MPLHETFNEYVQHLFWSKSKKNISAFWLKKKCLSWSFVHHICLQHTLLESEAENIRSSILSALQRIKCFGEEVNESVRRFGSVIQQIEGGYQVMQTEDNNTTVSEQVCS